MSLPPQTKIFTADNISGADIIPISSCTTIRLTENVAEGGQPSAGFLVKYPVTGDYISKPAGYELNLTKAAGYSFTAGTVLGKIKAAAGTISFSQEEF